VILLDTSGLLAAIDSSQREHAACASALLGSRGPRLLSPFVLAELDYLLGTRVGAAAQAALLDEVARGVYQLEAFGALDIAAAAKVIQRFAKLRIGLSDASLVVLAERHRVGDVLTLDRRHFRVLRRANGRRFRVLP
jgi:predicted nucleic acid-binding protein